MSAFSMADYGLINLGVCIKQQAERLGIEHEGVPLEGVVVRIAERAAGVVAQPEPEYEYRLVLELHPPRHAAWDQAETLWYPTVEEARATGKARDWIAHYRIDYPRAKFTERVERRIVAGEPETAPNQEGQP